MFIWRANARNEMDEEAQAGFCTSCFHKPRLYSESEGDVDVVRIHLQSSHFPSFFLCPLFCYLSLRFVDHGRMSSISISFFTFFSFNIQHFEAEGENESVGEKLETRVVCASSVHFPVYSLHAVISCDCICTIFCVKLPTNFVVV